MKKAKQVLFLSVILCFAQLCNGQIPQPKLTEHCPCAYPGIHFKTGESKLSDDNKEILAFVAKHLKANPEGHLLITVSSGYTKVEQSLCAARIKMINNYMAEKLGISFDRVQGICTGTGETGIVDLSCVKD